MTNLDCNVKSCCHNDNEDARCCLSSINVQGHNACQCDETCCGSFFEDKTGAGKNSCKDPNETLDITCEAVNCVYNDNKACNAEHIDISGVFASSSGETVCSTFKEK